MKNVFLAAGLLALPTAAAAQAIVNEMAWMGTPVEGVDSKQEWRYEWLELHNVSELFLDTTGWKIELYQGKESEPEFAIALEGSIEPREYFVVGADERIPGADLSYNNLGGKFRNNGQRIVLKNANGEVLEEVDASDGWFAGDKESRATMERRFPELPAGGRENWGTSRIPGGTPGIRNSIFGVEAGALTDAKPLLREEGQGAALPSFFSFPVLLALLAALGSALLGLLALKFLRP